MDDNRALLTLYPSFALVEIPLEPLRQAGLTQPADQMLERSCNLAPRKKLAKKYPTVPCIDLNASGPTPPRFSMTGGLKLVGEPELPGTPFAHGP